MTDPQVIVNLGTGGSDLNGQNGSTSSADSNDARFLDWPGDNAGNYVYLPDVNANYLSVADDPSVQVAGDIDLRVYATWETPPGNRILISKYETSGNQREWSFGINSSSVFFFGWSADGVSATFTNATESVTDAGYVFGDPAWFRVTFDVDNGASGNDIKFYWSADGSAWTQVGTTITTAGVASIYDGTSKLDVGARGNSGIDAIGGKIYRAQVFDGIGGTLVLDVDTSVITSGSATSFTDLTGNHTVTINRSSSGRKSVAVVSPVWLFGTDDRMEVADNALLDFGASDDATVLIVTRRWNQSVTNDGYLEKRDAGNAGYLIYSTTNNLTMRMVIDDGPDNSGINGDANTDGSANVNGFTLERSTNDHNVITNGVITDTNDASAVGDLSNSEAVTIGFGSGGYTDFELLGVAVFRRALTAGEIASISTYYQNKVA